MPDIRVTLSPDLHKELKVAAAEAGITLRQYVLIALHASINAPAKPKKG